ncbi:SPOR domain-containing protein [Robbsia sp. KACC 23696]|uniref:SPOR domain-containing protein n=1 Tax=Robbsia sp. KACC 23696 TaxID=3149231 RepID=UPI00325B3472
MGIFSFGSKRSGSSATSGRTEGGGRGRASTTNSRSRRLEPGLDIGAGDSERAAGRSRRARGVGQEAMLDPTLPEKQRARRRLVGAIALVLAAVIILPMVLDATPKPASGDIAIDIPDQGQGAGTASSAARSNAVIDSGADAVHQDVAAAASNTDAARSAPTSGNAPAVPPATAKSPTSSTPNAGNAAPKSAAGATSQRFAEVFDSASSAIDGGTSSASKSGTRASGGVAATAAADSDLAARVAALPATPATPGARYVVQLGSFESTASAQEWVRKLKRIGVPAFVNTDKGADGAVRAQLRAGPFADRTTAQAAVQKVRLAGLAQTADAGGGR